MLKRQRSELDDRSSRPETSLTDGILTKQPHLEPDITTPRRSARLEQKNRDLYKSQSHPTSPTPSVEQEEKRKSTTNEIQQSKRRRITRLATDGVCSEKHPDSITYWIFEDAALPPPDYFPPAPSMLSQSSGRKRERDDSTSRSTRISERYAKLMGHGVSMSNMQKMSESGQKLCGELLPSSNSSRPPAGFPFYQEQHRNAVLERAATASEAIIQRDILPTVIPSVQNLSLLELDFYKDIELNAFIDEINAEWTRVTPMGGRKPKPDYVAGLGRCAFDSTIWDTLMRYANTETPILLSPEMCFPLVIGEAKRGSNGIQEAMLQATQAAAIAIRSQISLHRAAYGDFHEMTTELYGYPLVFSVCHNHDEVHILAHYALFENNKLQFCYQKLAILSLTCFGGRDQDMSNTFIENVYKKCIPSHLSRLRAVAKKLHEKEERKQKEEAEKENKEQEEKRIGIEVPSQGSTGISFEASQLGLADDPPTDTVTEDSQGSGIGKFKKPRLPASVKAARDLAQIHKLLADQQVEFKRREEKLETQFKHREEKLETQLADQLVEFKHREEKFETQLADQLVEFKHREEKFETQLAQLIELLTKND